MNRKTIRFTVFAALVLVFAVSAFGQQFEPENNFGWLRVDNGVRIRGYTGNNTDLRIPSHIQGMPVTSIGADAFSGKGLTSVVIPNTVTQINAGAFRGNRLTEVVIPGSVIVIGGGLMSGAFENNQLTSVTISNGVREIGVSAFAGNRLVNVTIPDSVSIIRTSAFANNQITSVNLPTTTKLESAGPIGKPFGNATVTYGQPQVAQQQPQQTQQTQQQQPAQQQQSNPSALFVGTWNNQGNFPATYIFRSDGTWEQQEGVYRFSGRFIVRGNRVELVTTQIDLGGGWESSYPGTSEYYDFRFQNNNRLLMGHLDLRRR